MKVVHAVDKINWLNAITLQEYLAWQPTTVQ